MPDNIIKCRVCQKEIKCVFDEETDITVPRIAAQLGYLEGGKQKSGNPQDKTHKVLIYLTCEDFHGPFSYEITLTEKS